MGLDGMTLPVARRGRAAASVQRSRSRWTPGPRRRGVEGRSPAAILASRRCRPLIQTLKPSS
jgi:hypothetical protein